MSKRELYVGTMKSAKSAQLLMKGYLLDEQGKKVLTFKPASDTRDGAYVTSRAMETRRPATVISEGDDGSLIRYMVWKHQPDVILIDELQFFNEKQVSVFAEISVKENVDIYAYGLMMSYNGKIFPSIIKAMESAFKVKTIEMSCERCISNATHHLLYLDGVLQVDGNSINVEDFKNKSQKYESVCYSCYLKALESESIEKAYLKKYPSKEKEILVSNKTNK